MTQTNKKKRAVITGASSGIGRAVALELARFGFELLLCARNWEKLLETETEIRDDGGVAYAFACDVGGSEDVCKLVEEASKRWDSVDVLFNNAGIGKAVSIQETTDDDWAEMISGSLTGTFHCCRGFLPLLLNAEAPVIINNASVAAHRGFSDFTAYSAAKGGVAAFSRSLREELRPQSVRVSTIFAGATDSPFWDGLKGEWDRSRMMDCESVARLIGTIATLPHCAQMEEVYLMPTGGAL